MEFHKNISKIIEDYDTFILDVWGVVHDGLQAYDGIIDALKEMKRRGKKVVFVSNTPRMNTDVIKIFDSFGITADLYKDIITSGEATYHYFKHHQETGYKEFGKKYFHIDYHINDQCKIFEELDYDKIDDIDSIDQANFCVITRFNKERNNPLGLHREIEACLNHDLPLICVNPDKSFIRSNGEEYMCAGQIAEDYEKMGGTKVVYFGKPYELIYQRAFDILGEFDKSRAIAIGDSYYTDMPGAARMGLDSALIFGALLSNKFHVKYGELPAKEPAEKFCKEVSITPTYALGGLTLA